MGSIHLANTEGTTKLCSDFIGEAQRRVQELLQNVDHTTDSYWHRQLDMPIKFVKDKKGPRYAFDVEASLFKPDSSNPW